MNFDTLGLTDALLERVRAQGYTEPTPIQAAAIPAILSGRDVIGLAQTGTGKTAAFVLPILQRLMAGRRGGIRALIITPTRELAEQINDAILDMSKGTGIRTATVYGGVGMGPQEQALRAGVDIIVACPGRLLDHMGRGYVKLDGLQTLVLDEADRMLDMGFLPAIRRILSHLPSRRQTLLFSATMVPEIRGLAESTTRDPQLIQVDLAAPATTVTHGIYPVLEARKTSLLLELLQRTDSGSVLIFTRTKHRANKVALQVEAAGYATARLHSNRSQNQRQLALDGFRDGTYRVLVATDIAARGIDVASISHVINYDIPDTSDAYIHRIGRTGRAARTGDAFTLVAPEDGFMVRTIERAIGRPLERRILAGFEPVTLSDQPPPPRQQQQRPSRPPRHDGSRHDGPPRHDGPRHDSGRPAATHPSSVRNGPPARPAHPAQGQGRPTTQQARPPQGPPRRKEPTR